MVARLGIVLSAVVVVLAGCAETPQAESHGARGTGDDTGAPPTTSSEPLPVKTSSERGGIRGVVVDAAIRPLAGAVVTLAADGRNVTTAADGQFAFDLLDPGTYFLEASAPRFLVSQSSVQVEAGKTQSVRLLLEGDGMPLPRHQTEQFTGFAEMDLGILAPDTLPQQCACSWTMYPEAGFRTFVVEGTGSGSLPRPPETGQGALKQVWWTFHDAAWTHGTGYNYADFPFSAHLAGDLFLNGTDEITIQVSGNNWPNGRMQFDVFVTTFYVDAAPEGWSLLKGDA